MRVWEKIKIFRSWRVWSVTCSEALADFSPPPPFFYYPIITYNIIKISKCETKKGFNKVRWNGSKVRQTWTIECPASHFEAAGELMMEPILHYHQFSKAKIKSGSSPYTLKTKHTSIVIKNIAPFPKALSYKLYLKKLGILKGPY